jgi:hypothetical protein
MTPPGQPESLRLPPGCSLAACSSNINSDISDPTESFTPVYNCVSNLRYSLKRQKPRRSVGRLVHSDRQILKIQRENGSKRR